MEFVHQHGTGKVSSLESIDFVRDTGHDSSRFSVHVEVLYIGEFSSDLLIESVTPVPFPVVAVLFHMNFYCNRFAKQKKTIGRSI